MALTCRHYLTSARKRARWWNIARVNSWSARAILHVGSASWRARDHLTWFSFEGEFVADYPCVLSGQTSQATIEAMMPCRVWRVSGEELLGFFRRSIKNMELRAAIGEHMLNQFKARYQDFHRATPHERYNLLMQRCPGIVEHLNLQDIASFLNVTPKTISKIRKEITFANK